MRRFIILISFILLSFPPSYAQSGKYDEAVKTSVNAVLAYPQLRNARKKIEEKIKDIIPLDKETQAVVGSAAIMAWKGEVNTQRIKSMKVRVMGGKMRPDAKFNWKTKEAGGEIKIKWEF